MNMNIDQLEKEAMATTTKHVINILQRPGQLEKIEQYKMRVSRKKVSVEGMLKTTVQSHLDGVCTGLGQLQLTKEECEQAQEALDEVGASMVELPELIRNLQGVEEKDLQYSQYSTAMENLKNLFSVAESLEETKQWINEGKLLYAHHSLNNLENSRDDLLNELHKVPCQNANKILLKGSFEDVQMISQLLEKQLRLTLSRTLNTVRKEPTELVTALRIIEKEEEKDAFAIQRQKRNGFMPPGRPKKWKAMALEVLQESVDQRIEGTQPESRSSNKMWLVMHLELTRQLIIEDLRVVSTLCEPCFPKHYNIVNLYVSMYHNSLSRHFEEIVAGGLDGNEYVSMLAWLKNTYLGPELMSSPELRVNTNCLPPLLNPEVMHDLQAKYLKNMEDNYVVWMKKTLETEQMDWSKGVALEGDQEGHFHTAAPVIIFQMIDQNLEVTKTIGQDLTDKALVLGMKQVKKYGHLYREAIGAFKNRNFEDRSRQPYFTHYMVTAVNNCILFVELAQQLKEHYLRTDFLQKELNATSSALCKTFLDLRNEAAVWLLEEASLDLESHFQDLLTLNWLMGSSMPVDTVCKTFDDYFRDYVHLRPNNFEYVIREAENCVARRYLCALLQKKITLNEERRTAGAKIKKEVCQLKTFFSRFAPQMADSPFEAVAHLAEILELEDKEVTSLEVHALVHKYPDVKVDQVTSFLSLRGDLSHSEIKDIVFDLQQSRSTARASMSKSIFSEL